MGSLRAMPRRAQGAVGIVVAIVAATLALLAGAASAQTPSTTTTTTTTVDPRVVATQLAPALALPSPAIGLSPPATSPQLVGLPTWLWVEPWAAQRASAPNGAGSVEVTATPAWVRWYTGDGSGLTCAGPGVRYDPSRPAAAQSTDCSYTWRRPSQEAPSGAFRLTATVTWRLAWPGGALGERTTTASVDVKVAEAQNLDRPPEPLPGQAIVGAPVGGRSGPSGGPAGGGAGGTDGGAKSDKCGTFDLVCKARKGLDGLGNATRGAWDGITGAAGAVQRCIGGDHTCLKVGGTVLAGAVTVVGVGALCATGVGCAALAIIAGGIAAGGVGGGLFCPAGHGIAGCVAKGGLLGGIAAIPFIFAPATLAGMMAAGGIGGLAATVLDQLMTGHFDPKSLVVNTLIGGGTGGPLHGLAKLWPALGSVLRRSEQAEGGAVPPVETAPPTGPKPPLGAPGAAEWRYQRYLSQQLGDGVTPDSVLPFETWKSRYYDPVVAGGRPGRRGGEEQVATKETLAREGTYGGRERRVGRAIPRRCQPAAKRAGRH